MKQTFTTLDLIVLLKELKNKIVGSRVDKIYDVDKKTYYIKFQGSDKNILVIESGKRLHLTTFGWPKNSIPSAVTMKMRKNVGSARVEAIRQLGHDRIVDMQFGSGDYAKHLIIELFDQGNLILTDHEYNIIMILRSRKVAGITIGTKYDIYAYKQFTDKLSSHKLEEIIISASDKDQVKRLFNAHLPYGIAIFEHVLLQHALPLTVGKLKTNENYLTLLENAVNSAHELFNELVHSDNSVGFLVHAKNSSETDIFYDDFIPYLFGQFVQRTVTRRDSFNEVVDLFYSNMENDKLTRNAKNMEAAGRQKSEKIIADHQQRLVLLKESQNLNVHKAVLIEENIELIEAIVEAILRGLSDGLSWLDISDSVEEYSSIYPFNYIKELKLASNTVTVHLQTDDIDPLEVDIDLSLTAYSNARRYYQIKKDLVQKEHKTTNSTEKALESAQKKANKLFKNAELVKTISKIRKPFWFEKFKWFISSDNLIVAAGSEQQQNELLVSRYLREGDIFVHADLTGAPVVVVKGRKNSVIPPRTLEEAGTMAVCLTNAWEAKMSVDAFWVHSYQVSKTPPTGEYLPAGSFMIRGKKNFIPSCRHVYGFGILFKTALIEDPKSEQIDQQTDFDNLTVSTEDADLSKEVIEEDGDIQIQDEVLEDETANEEDVKTSGDEDLWEKNDLEMTEFILSARPITTEFKNFKITPKIEEKSSIEAKTSKNWSKAKRRKFMKKYGDEDDHDLAVKMTILGSAGEPKERKNKKQERQQKAQEARLHHQKRLEEKLRKQAAEKPTDVQFVLKDDPIEYEFESLRSLTADPAEGDELLYAIPVCAPYSALSAYKFKLKLLQGPTKRGKACRQALNILMNDSSASDVEKSLMKTLVDIDLSKSAPACLKVVYKTSQFKKK